jgi:hypothetical protein
MGQTVSRRIVPMLERWRAQYHERLTKEALEIIEKQKEEAMKNPRRNNPHMVSTTLYTDPNARLLGFQRGQQYQTISEEDLERQINANRALDEMDPKLLQFLKDVGPVVKVSYETTTGRRVVQAETGDPNNQYIQDSTSSSILRPHLTSTSAHKNGNQLWLTDDQINFFLLDTSTQGTLSPTLQKALQTVSIPIFTLHEHSRDQDEPMFIATAAPVKNSLPAVSVAGATTAPHSETKVQTDLS